MSSKDDIFNYSIQPWISQDEFIEFYSTLFPRNNISQINSISNNNINNTLDLFIDSLSLENLQKSMIYLIKWDSREDNKMFCLPIILLINALIKLKEKKITNKDINSSHILAEIIIRVINIIMDQLRKTKKVTSMNMYLIAKSLQLPEFIIDIRHSSTHKNLPNFNQLVFAIKYIFFWIKKKLIEPKYNTFIKEKKYFMMLLNRLNSDKNDVNINNDDIAKLEPEHLLIVITQLFINFKKYFIYNKSKNTITYNNDKIKPKIQLFKEILDKEKELFILMIFSFIYQQIKKINSNEKISNEEKNKYKQYLICFSKLIYNNTDKKIKFDLKKYEILYISIYNNITQIKDEYKIIYEIFINTFQNSIKNINLEDNEIESDEYVVLNKIEGDIKEIKIEYEKINEMFNGNNNREEKNEMDVEKNGENDCFNMDFKDNYKNFNSIII